MREAARSPSPLPSHQLGLREVLHLVAEQVVDGDAAVAVGRQLAEHVGHNVRVVKPAPWKRVGVGGNSECELSGQGSRFG